MRGWPLLILALAVMLAAPAHAADRWDTVPDPKPLPRLRSERRIDHYGARIWFATLGRGRPVILLHPGTASSDLWGNQIPALVAAHRRVILVDSRGHGRSTWDGRPLHYEDMAADVVAVMDALHLKRSAVVGWSDGAIVGLIMAMKSPERVTRVYAFGANMDVTGLNITGLLAPTLRPSELLMQRIYERVSPTPGEWGRLSNAVTDMQLTEPEYSADAIARIKGPRIAVADGDHEEFITRAHTDYLARTIPGARLILLDEVSHFAPLQDPKGFNASLLGFLATR
jgi:pimeloyl-ACP methyl ester carboxylesterase